MSQLVELRSYTLVPGAVEAFVDHFERHFLASQEALGMDVIGQFTVPGDDARFVWVRRFVDPGAGAGAGPDRRAAALAAFYGGPVWRRHGPRANELMVDHTDVHLLTPDPSAPSLAAAHVPHADRGGLDAATRAPTTVVAATYDLSPVAPPSAAGSAGAAPGGVPVRAALPAVVVSSMAEALAAPATAGTGAPVAELGRLVTAAVANGFPRLPVHEDATVAVWLLSDRDGGASATAAAERVAAAHALPVRTTRLSPTPRSTLR